MINQCLIQLSWETRKALYDSLGNLQWPAFAGILLWVSFRYKVPLKHKVILWVTFIIARFWGCGMVPVLSNLTHGIIPSPNMGIGFGLTMLVLAAITYFLNAPVLFSLDAAIPAFILGRGLAITGCVFFGCCYGFPVSWGIYSGVAQTVTFPTVLLDIVLSCCIVGYLMLLSRRQKFSGNGTVAAKGMILFGLLRILIDILRDKQKLILLLTAEGLFGVVYVVGGYLILRHIYHKRCK